MRESGFTHVGKQLFLHCLLKRHTFSIKSIATPVKNHLSTNSFFLNSELVLCLSLCQHKTISIPFKIFKIGKYKSSKFLLLFLCVGTWNLLPFCMNLKISFFILHTGHVIFPLGLNGFWISLRNVGIFSHSLQ